MAEDVLQSKRKLKHPQVRKWSYEKGEWGYYSWRGTKARLNDATNKKSTNKVHWVVAYKGKEYSPKSFLKKFPKFKLKK